MGQLLIRNLDDTVIATLKRRAAAAGHSMEAEARATLRSALKVDKLALVREAQAMTATWRDDSAPQGWELIREDRDSR